MPIIRSNPEKIINAIGKSTNTEIKILLYIYSREEMSGIVTPEQVISNLKSEIPEAELRKTLKDLIKREMVIEG